MKIVVSHEGGPNFALGVAPWNAVISLSRLTLLVMILSFSRVCSSRASTYSRRQTLYFSSLRQRVDVQRECGRQELEHCPFYTEADKFNCLVSKFVEGLL